MVIEISKKEYKRIQSLKKYGASGVPKGIYFIGIDKKAYKADDRREAMLHALKLARLKNRQQSLL